MPTPGKVPLLCEIAEYANSQNAVQAMGRCNLSSSVSAAPADLLYATVGSARG